MPLGRLVLGQTALFQQAPCQPAFQLQAKWRTRATTMRYGQTPTQDYRYRFIVDPAFGDRPNVRNELVTFPDATEDYVLSRYICAHPDILEDLTVSSISRR